MKKWTGTKWTFEDGRTIGILDILDTTKDLPVEVLPIDEVIRIRTVSSLEQQRVDEADTTYPILIVKEEGRSWILDGNHRLQKAMDEGHTTIRAKILRGVI